LQDEFHENIIRSRDNCPGTAFSMLLNRKSGSLLFSCGLLQERIGGSQLSCWGLQSDDGLLILCCEHPKKEIGLSQENIRSLPERVKGSR
jgi:hypothetical protein